MEKTQITLGKVSKVKEILSRVGISTIPVIDKEDSKYNEQSCAFIFSTEMFLSHPDDLVDLISAILDKPVTIKEIENSTEVFSVLENFFVLMGDNFQLLMNVLLEALREQNEKIMNQISIVVEKAVAENVERIISSSNLFTSPNKGL